MVPGPQPVEPHFLGRHGGRAHVAVPSAHRDQEQEQVGSHVDGDSSSPLARTLE